MSVKLTTPLAKTWKRRLDRWRQSGLSAAVFSKQEKVSQPSLYKWRKRFAAAGQEAAVPAPIFVPVRVQPGLAVIELTLNGGHVLRLPADYSPAHLVEILQRVAAC